MKKWYLSKTLWVNGLTIIIGGVTMLTSADWLIGHSWCMPVATMILGGANILLRFITKSPLASFFFRDDVVKQYGLMDVPEANRHYNILEVRK